MQKSAPRFRQITTPTAHHSLNMLIKIKPVKGAEINLFRWQFVTDREYWVGLLCRGKL